MGTLDSIVRAAYRRCVPDRVKKSGAMTALKSAVYRSRIGHNIIYNADYYEQTVEGPAVRSAGAMADDIVADLGPASVLDVGCGTGALMEAIRERGCSVQGLEYADAALTYCRKRGLEVTKFDLENDDLAGDRSFDVAVSLEVAEHLPESVADPYVNLLTRSARTVVFTAAPPGQGGADHVNEQPPGYWIEKFGGRGFELDDGLTNRWKSRWEASGVVQSWYYQNLMVFRKDPHS